VAVREITRRLKELIRDHQVHDDLRFVSVRTFDSFATRILLAAQIDKDLSGFSYDPRIELAIETLEDPESEASQIVAGYRHLIVDEIQDLVGVRARLVQALLKRISGGFTLLGDPAQAIYGFSVTEKAKTLNAQTLLEWVQKQQWTQSLLQRQLTENHRFQGATTRMAASLRTHILQGNKDESQTLEQLRHFVTMLGSAGSGKQPASNLTAGSDNSICILCRSNGEVLQLASLFAMNHIPFVMRPRPEDSGLPAWIGRVLGTHADSRISWREFEDRWNHLVARPGEPNAEQAWEYLRRVECAGRVDLDLNLLHRNLSKGAVLPDDIDAFLQEDTGCLAVSTIHAMKGREFDRVVILQPDTSQDRSSKIDTLEEARVLYVAATRARRELDRLDRGGLPVMWKEDCPNGRSRWIARTHTGYYFVEIGLGGDIDGQSSVSTYIFPSQEAALISQDVLWNQVRPGIPIKIYEVRRGKYVFFRVTLEQNGKKVDLGQMSLTFKQDISHLLMTRTRNRYFPYPKYFDSIQVVAVVTEVLPAFPENTHGPFSSSRFCIGLRVRGMGYLYKE